MTGTDAPRSAHLSWSHFITGTFVCYTHTLVEYVVNKLTNTINQNRSGSLLKMYTCVYTRVPQLYYPGTSLHTYRTLIGTVSCERSHVSQIFRLGPRPFPKFLTSPLQQFCSGWLLVPAGHCSIRFTIRF